MVTNKDAIIGVNDLFQNMTDWEKNLGFFKKLKMKIKYHAKPVDPAEFIIDGILNYEIFKNREQLQKLSEKCVWEDIKLKDAKGKDVVKKCMTYSTDEYRKFYNHCVVDEAIKFLKLLGVEKVAYGKGRKSIDVWLDKPGVLIGHHGETIKFVEDYACKKIRVHGTTVESFDSKVNRLYYGYCANDWEDLL